jgi:hypothetical protein
MKFDEKFIKEYAVDGNIAWTKYFVAWYVDDQRNTVTIFNFMAKIGNALSYHITNLFQEKFPDMFNNCLT